jgi:hypothetical protein
MICKGGCMTPCLPARFALAILLVLALSITVVSACPQNC